MYSCKVGLKSINEVKEFSGIMNTLSYEADLTSGKYVVDAKSIMGIFSLDLSGQLELKIYLDDAQSAGVGGQGQPGVDDIVSMIKKFVVE